MRIISIGEILWDVIGGQEHLGGALLNFSTHAARLGHEVSLVSAVGSDPRGYRALEAMSALGLTIDRVQRSDEWPTGIVTVTVAGDGQPEFEIHRPAAYDSMGLANADLESLVSWNPDWICYGTLLSMYPRGRSALLEAMDAIPCARHFYDVNLRPRSFTSELVRELMRRATVVKLNEDEVGAIAEMSQRSYPTLEQFCRDHAAALDWEAVCVTRGALGCAILARDQYVEAPGYHVQVADTVGAGDAFAAAFLHGLDSGWPVAQIGDFANRLGAFVASRRGGVAPWSLDQIQALSRSG
ncbi:MAG: PfkB family carbohydrate kinase [Acidobacteriota bacterium]